MSFKRKNGNATYTTMEERETCLISPSMELLRIFLQLSSLCFPFVFRSQPAHALSSIHNVRNMANECKILLERLSAGAEDSPGTEDPNVPSEVSSMLYKHVSRDRSVQPQTCIM